MHLGQKSHRPEKVHPLVHLIQRHMMSVCLSIMMLNLISWLRCYLEGFFTRIILPFVITQCSVGRIINTMNVSCSLMKTSPLTFNMHWWFSPESVIAMLSNGDSLTLPCFQYLFIAILLMRKSFPFTHHCSFIYINMGSRNPIFFNVLTIIIIKT